jgi:hypothetical protein
VSKDNVKRWLRLAAAKPGIPVKEMRNSMLDGLNQCRAARVLGTVQLFLLLAGGIRLTGKIGVESSA